MQSRVILIAAGIAARVLLQGQSLPMPNPPASPNIPNVTATLHAPADGVTDATQAINNAMAALASRGGGTLQFPAGTYLVHVNPGAPDYVLQLQSSVRLMGSSSGVSTILLAGNQPAYNTLLGTGGTINDVDIENLTIDLNSENNVINSISDYHAGVRAALRGFSGARWKLAYCTIQNIADVNTVYLNGTISDIEIGNTIFRNVGQPPGSFDYDHSTIYANSTRVWIHDNTFSTLAGIGTPGGRTGLETHGSDMNVSNNTINDYSLGMIITGQALNSNRELCNNNTIANVMNAIEIVSVVYSTNNTIGMQNITIENNQITLNPNAWRLSGLMTTTEPSEGIFLNPSMPAPLPIVGMSILNNTITFPSSQGSPVSGDTNSGGIELWTYNGLMTAISNLTISGNSVSNSLGPGIWTNINLNGGTAISSNTISNPARSSASAETTGLYISATASNIQVNNNAVSDTASTPLITSGTSAVSLCASSCTAKGNTVSPNTIPPTILAPNWRG